MIHVPNDSTYLWLDKGYWESFQPEYIESAAMELLNTDGLARAAHCTEIRRLTQLKSIIELGRELNELNGYVNLQNGMLNVESRELKPHDKEHYSTIQLPVKYNPKARCPRWYQFLDEIFEGDQERADLLQEFMGYSFVPDTRYEKALLLVGEGSNGKSVSLGVWEHVIGKGNYCSVTLGSLQNQFHRIQLTNKLLNIAAEVRETTLEQADYFKRIVSGDTIDAAHKFKDVLHFRPFARLVFAMNRLPRVKDTSLGYYRRLLIVPFNRIFTPAEQDKQLRQKLITEADGIFAWCLEGLDRLYDNDGFAEPQAVRDAIAQYKRANNPVVAFVEDTCRLDPAVYTAKNVLYGAYKQYCEDFGFRAASVSTFYRELYASFDRLSSVRPRDGAGRGYMVEGIEVMKNVG